MLIITTLCNALVRIEKLRFAALVHANTYVVLNFEILGTLLNAYRNFTLLSFQCVKLRVTFKNTIAVLLYSALHTLRIINRISFNTCRDAFLVFT